MGFVIDFGELKSYLSELLGKIDHTYLNDSLEPPFLPPSAEKISEYIHSQISKKLDRSPAPHLSVRVWETESTWVEFTQ